MNERVHRFEETLRGVTPPDDVHRGYWVMAKHFAGLMRLGRELTRGPIRDATLRKSAFFGREYLVVVAYDEWIAKVAPGCDAFAKVGEGLRPAAAFIPASRRGDRRSEFRSILEHEFVHVNQVLLQRFPMPAKSASAIGIEFSLRLRSEYEAHFLQHCRWPEEHPQHIDDEQWTLLRAYSNALEVALTRAAELDVDAPAVGDLLADVNARICTTLEPLKVPTQSLAWLMDRARSDVAIAVGIVAQCHPQLMESSVLDEALRWSAG